MSAPARVSGVPGKRAPKRAPALRLARLLTGSVPEHPASTDYLAALGGGWQMLGNDVAGDCVAVTYANVRRLVTSTLTATPSYPSQDEVWAVYKTQNPDFDPNGDRRINGPGSPADGGMDVQTLLEYLTATGGPDGVKAVAFAAVDPSSPDEVKAAIAVFGYVWTGINVSAAQPAGVRRRAAVGLGRRPVRLTAATPSSPEATGPPARARSAVTSGSSPGRPRPASPTRSGLTASTSAGR